MSKRKVLKITPILIVLNVLILLFIVGFYTTRLIKYYIAENGGFGEDEDKTVILAEEIIKKQSRLDETKGLVYDSDNNIYRYKGEVDDNYIYYSGMIYRIIAIDNEGNIRAVSQNNVTLLYSGLEKGFKDSYVNTWLNKSDKEHSGIYERELVNSDELLADTYTCLDTIDDLTEVTCKENKTDYRISLMSLYDYRSAGGKSSYLNNGESYSLITNDSKNENYYVTTDGEIAVSKKSSRISYIRPVITISSGAELIEGKGTLDEPYIIEKHEIKTLSDVYVGNYVKIDDILYRVNETNEDKVRLIMSEVLMEKVKETDSETKEEKEVLKPISMKFGGSDSVYNPNGDTVGSYLNGTFLNSLSLKDKVIESKWYVGKQALDNLSYTLVYGDSVDAYIGMPTIGEFYNHEQNNILTTLRGLESSKLVNVINKEGHLYSDRITSKYYVRPEFYLDGKVNIKSGNGSLDNPYVLGDSNEKTEERKETKD